MPDLTSASPLADNYEKFVINTSDAGKEYILSITSASGNLTDAKLQEAYNYLTQNNYTSSNTDGSAAGTWAGLGTADGTALDYTADSVAYVRFQSTEAFAITDYNANISDTQVAIVAVFTPAK